MPSHLTASFLFDGQNMLDRSFVPLSNGLPVNFQQAAKSRLAAGDLDGLLKRYLWCHART